VKEDKRFYKQKWFIVLMLFIFTPLGILLLWLNKTWKHRTNVILTMSFSVYFILFGILAQTDEKASGNGDEEEKSSMELINDDKEDKAKERKLKYREEKLKDEEKRLRDREKKLKDKEKALKDRSKKQESNKKDSLTERDILKSDIKTSFKTNIEKPQHTITKEDYKKYNDIMKYLNQYPEKDEDTLFKELESVYGEPAADLKKFINSTMQDAIDYDSGKTINDVSLEEQDIKNSTAIFFKKNVKDADLLDIDSNKADVTITNLRAISKGELSYDSIKFNYILKTEFTGDLQETNVFQLKINEINIDL